jgi:hypothetical protein
MSNLNSPAAYLPKGARPQPRPARPSFKTRRYEISWLSPDGMVETATRIAPALPDFEEAFSAIARGTLIETPDGLVAIEDLEPGMSVLTADGRAEKVVWIGSMTVFPADAVPGLKATKLTRITAEAFGQGRPMPDLLLGETARLLMKDARCRSAGLPLACVPVSALIDGESIVEISPVAPVTMFNMVLARHGAVRCAGVEIEAYHPGKAPGERFDPELAQLFIALFPQARGFADFGTMAYPRLTAEAIAALIAA